VLAHEARGAIVVDNELQGLVVPAIGTVAMPILVGPLLKSDRLGVVQADDEGSRLNGLEKTLVARASLEQSDASIGPDVTVFGSQGADGGHALGSESIDAFELAFKLRSIELLATNVMVDLEKLISANGNDVLVALSRELDRVVGGPSGDARGVEHPLVAVHADGQLLHVLGLESAGVDELLEFEHGRGDGGGALGRFTTCAIVTMGIKVADVGNDRVAIRKVGRVIPPLVDPILGRRVLATRDKLVLKAMTNTAGLNELGDGSLAGLELGRREERMKGFEVSLRRLLERRDRQARQGVLEPQHGTLGLVLGVACAQVGVSR